jgi:hypothetical protein
MQEIEEALKWVVGVLTVLCGWILKRITSKIDGGEKAMQAHIESETGTLEKYVLRTEWVEFKGSMYSRFDKLEANDRELVRKMDSILEKIGFGASRNELENLKDQVHGRINDLEKRMPRPGL